MHMIFSPSLADCVYTATVGRSLSNGPRRVGCMLKVATLYGLLIAKRLLWGAITAIVSQMVGWERSAEREKFDDWYASTVIEFRRLHGDRYEIDETHAAFLTVEA